MTRSQMSKIIGGGGNVTKVPIIDQIDKFILKKRTRKKNRVRGFQKNLGWGDGGGIPCPLDLPVDTCRIGFRLTVKTGNFFVLSNL